MNFKLFWLTVTGKGKKGSEIWKEDNSDKILTPPSPSNKIRGVEGSGNPPMKFWIKY